MDLNTQLPITVIIIAIMGMVAFYRAGRADAKDYFEHKAIEDGKAEYYLDENNNREWRWKG